LWSSNKGWSSRLGGWTDGMLSIATKGLILGHKQKFSLSAE
jgi:hypothetical protein